MTALTYVLIVNHLSSSIEEFDPVHSIHKWNSISFGARRPGQKSRESKSAGASFVVHDDCLKDPSFKHGGYCVGATKIGKSDGKKDQGRTSLVDPPRSKPPTRACASASSPGFVPLMDLVLPSTASLVSPSTRPCPPPPPLPQPPGQLAPLPLLALLHE